MCLCVRVSVRASVCVYVRMYVRVRGSGWYARMYVYTHVCMYVGRWVDWVCACVRGCIYLPVCACVCVFSINIDYKSKKKNFNTFFLSFSSLINL